ncbi:MAG: glycosyltransferase [Bacteroidia bacterium]|nr:glycosyltransferase [Bacteroidia bacterium]
MSLSIVVPVFNRPEEVRELLESLSLQKMKDFEVIIVEDGSTDSSEQISKSFSKKLHLKYFYKSNSGPGMSRNYGAERSGGDYIIFFDSDCIIPEDYTQTVTNVLNQNYTDAYGGPDKAHPSFSNIQKAINYSMVSFLTTGGIRGGKKSLDKFFPRSFNMGISRRVFETTGGFSSMRFGEDIDFSLRILQAGFQTALIPEAFVYHKRRSDFRSFFKQVFNSGVARINLFRRHPGSLKIVHVFPSLFIAGTLLLVIISFIAGAVFLLPVFLYCLLLFIDSWFRNRNFTVAALSVIAGIEQVFAYGLGFILAAWKRLVLKQGEFHAYRKNFYK